MLWIVVSTLKVRFKPQSHDVTRTTQSAISAFR